MRKNPYLAGLLAASVGVAELAEAGENPRLMSKSEPAIDSAPADSIAGNPHTHNDLERREYMAATAPSSASGNRSDDSFQLSVVSQRDGILLIGSPFANYRRTPSRGPLSSLRKPEYEFEKQRMYRKFGDIEGLIGLLASRPEFPQAQLDGIRRNALAGGLQVIGGYTQNRIFGRRFLEELGMNFRPPDC